ncbi:MAG: hypothetical protein JNK82_40250 [Myxococcaceae bacterium]|nr:hypothetical protein [Myxococcaceae bacterium]
MRWLLLLGATLGSFVHAQSQTQCDQPRPRDTAALLKAIQEDDAMASTFDVTSGACSAESAACDAQKLKCNDQLTTMLQRQVNVDNGTWLRDMLLPFNGQRYTMSSTIATTEVAQDVSCNADAASLKAAAQRRRQLAQRRRDIVNEYPKWAMWAAGVAQKCKTDSAAAAKASADATAVAKAQADAALAAKTAEELRQENAKKAEAAAKDKLEADKRAKEEAARLEAERLAKAKKDQEELLKRQQEMLAEQQRKEREAKMSEEERRAEALKRAEEEKKRAAEEAEAKRKAAEDEKKAAAAAAADAKFVADREAKKTAAEKKASELRAAEDKRREEAEKAIAAQEGIDRSDERLKGSIGAQLQGAYMSLNGTNSGFLMGLAVQLRYGIWMTAPAQGMASGMELRLGGQFLGLVAGQGGAQFFTITPELRWFFARFGVGATFEYRRLNSPLTNIDPADAYTVGLNVAVAILDSPDSRFIIGLKWLPFFVNSPNIFQAERALLDVEIGYKWFMASVQGGLLGVRNGTSTTVGWYAGIGLGGRLRF